MREWYGTTASQIRADYRRPWWAIDIGNNVNYVINGTSGRTFGVTGMWHRDDARPPVLTPNPDGSARTLNAPSEAFPRAGLESMTPQWSVLEGSYSAWMGLRALHDVRFVDPITGQPYSGEARKFNSGGISYFGDFTGHHGLEWVNNSSFPGYMSQMDQMLYRDIDLAGLGSDDLNLSFTYATEMSTGYNNSASTRVGWFNYDPLAPTYDGTTTGSNLAEGNFISSTDAGDSAPIDSFMVYVGKPVDSSFEASDGFTYDVYDPQRRWFSEVLDIGGYAPGSPPLEPLYIKEVLSVAGSHAATPVNVTIANATLAPILAASGGRLRVVFRVKTNRTWDDEHTTYATDLDGPGGMDPVPGSGGRGAAQVDAVTYAWGGAAPGSGDPRASPGGWGDFEAEGSIDNHLAVNALDAWKSTGKPPASYAHPEALSTLPYGSLCGGEDDPRSLCDMSGVVLVFGDRDHSNASGGSMEGTADREPFFGAYSPTILLATPEVGENAIGLSRDEATPTEDYYIKYDAFTGLLLGSTGNWWRVSFQAYPTLDRNGNQAWSSPTYPPYIRYWSDPVCLGRFEENGPPAFMDAVLGNDMLRTSNASGIPDSVIIGVSKYQACFRVSLPTCGFTQGGYFDNISFVVVDGTPVDLWSWSWYQDSFPANETAGLPGTAGFDTTTAYTKVGGNIAPPDPTSFTSRYMVPGDSAKVLSARADEEVYLVFRILPGPGNYVDIGHPEHGNGLRMARPGLAVGPSSGLPAIPSDALDFFESYMADNGIHGTPGGHPAAPSGWSVPKRWDPNVWNSARCDTAERMVFPQAGSPTGWVGALDPHITQSTYHDSETRGHWGNLGIRRNLCFYPTPTSPVQEVVCNSGTPPVHVAPAGAPVANPASGWPGIAAEAEGLWFFNGPQVVTTEGTKIFPDGIFTPGTHIQYFFARYPAGAGSGAAPDAMVPDSNVVFPQWGEGSADGHRWAQFGILPDLWKTDGYVHPVTGDQGAGLACMLVYDNLSGAGNELNWVGIADTIGATSQTRQGAHNGWRATPADGGVSVNDPAYFQPAHLGQPGTTWDLYQGGGSGAIGVRLGRRGDGSNPQMDGKESRLGPTPEMLNVYYRVILHMTAFDYIGILGPRRNASQDDVAMLTAFLTGDPGAEEPTRGYWVIGESYVEDAFISDEAEGQSPDVEAFVDGVLGVNLKSRNYVSAAANLAPSIPLTVEPIVTGGDPHGAAAVRGHCLFTPDVLERSLSLSAFTVESAYYDDNGSLNAPFPSSIYKRWDETSKYIAYVDGWDLWNLTGLNDVSSGGRIAYMYLVLQNLFGEFCTVNGTPIGLLDVPNIADSRMYDFARFCNNPVESGMAKLHLGLAQADRVEVKIFDVSGRVVRTLADRIFEAGEHDLCWDGTDDGGRRMHRGVYFTKLRYEESGFTAKGKVVFLK